MFIRFKTYGCLLLFGLCTLAQSALAQVTVNSLTPRTVSPGATTNLQVAGVNLQSVTGIVCEDNHVTVSLENIEADKATLVVTAPADCSRGAMKVWFASDGALAGPFGLVVDDMPPLADNGQNHSFETAQVLQTPQVAVEGTCGAATTDFYRFTVAPGQRVAFEILTHAIGSALDPMMTLLDKDQNRLAFADESATGAECRFDHTFTEGGDYVIGVADSRYASGGSYHLRIGDFPIVHRAQPLGISPGQSVSATGTIESIEGVLLEPVATSVSSGNSIGQVAFRLPGGSASAWTPVRIWSGPLHIEGPEPSASPLTIPIGISGHLVGDGESDTYSLQGVAGQPVRFVSRTRSLRCPTLLKMELLNAAGAKVAETAVTEADEWSFDYTFPDDGVYQLRVRDLLNRGGNLFGYWIEIAPLNRFSIALKGDAATQDQFIIEAGAGACPIDLVIDRQGYDGPIELQFAQEVTGFEIVNPRIPAAAKEARIYLKSNAQWLPTSLSKIRLRGIATENHELTSDVSTFALAKVRMPEDPFPTVRESGLVVVAGATSTEPLWDFQPAAPIRLGRPIAKAELPLNLVRKNEAFKDSVAILASSAVDGWNAKATLDKEILKTELSRGEDTSEFPSHLTIQGYSALNGRGRIDSVQIPIEWFDPLRVTVESSTRLKGGIQGSLSVTVQRDGDDPQPVVVQLENLPEGVVVDGPITIPADQSIGEIKVTLPVTWPQKYVQLAFSAASQFQTNAFSVSGQTNVIDVLPTPTTTNVVPAVVTLSDPKSRQQMVVTGIDSAGQTRDWTRDAQFLIGNPEIVELRGTVLFPKANGTTDLVVQSGVQTVTVPVTVTGMETPHRTAFENEVLVALSKQGCNSGACHGSPSGKGMFRLSLRAFDSKLDELTLIREDFGRRLNTLSPEESLLLLKPMMQVAHGGGKHLDADDEAYAILRDWISEGAKTDPPETARCVRLEVYPNEKRILNLIDGIQQLSVTAHFADGTSRDVTHLVSYESSNQQVATVDAYGYVKAQSRGESVILVRFLEHIESVPLMFVEEVAGFAWNAPQSANYIDELVNEKLLQMQYVPAPTCSDEEFIRRVTLDITGLLPTPDETTAFLADADPNKRARWIDELLERDEYAKFWALKWGDLLRMTSKVISDRGVYKYHRWVELAFDENMPYDQFARELLTASGSTLSNPPANFFRAAADMNDSVETVSQLFLGARLQCAKCHNHPFERWTQDNYYGLGAFFNRVQRRKTQRPDEMFIWHSDSGEVTQPRTSQTMQPWAPGVGSMEIESQVDRRTAFADWLIRPDNPYFAKVEANRIWSQLFARGIVDPIDDFRDSNPPTNGPLLDALAKDFAENGFDRKHLIRTILNSKTYQASFQTNELNRDDSLYFSHQQPRLLGAEQLLDAVNQATGVTQTLGKLPAGTLATHLPAPDVVKIDFLKVFGQPERSTVCACERADDSNLGMAIELLNGPTIHERLRDPNNRFRKALAQGVGVEQVLKDLYLAALARSPSDTELKSALEHCQRNEDVAAAVEDICWALLNTDEFLFQH